MIIDSNKISVINALLKALTWKKISQVIGLMLVILFLSLIYDFSTEYETYATNRRISASTTKVEKLSKKSMAELDAIVKQPGLVIAAKVTIVDFEKNTRLLIYTTTADPGLNAVYEKYSQSFTQFTPLFDSDLTTNRRTVELINGEFVCYPWTESASSQDMPEAAKYIQTVCATGIPPYYGRFSGALMLYLRYKPSNIEIDMLRAMAKSVALTIYNRDFI